MEDWELENRIRDLEERLRKEEETNKKALEDIKELLRKADEHTHSGYDESSSLRSDIKLDPNSQLSIAGSGFYNGTQYEGTSSEVNFTLITAGNSVEEGLDANKSGNSQLTLQSAAAISGNTFFYGFRPPIYQNVGTTITQGGSTLTDGYFNWTTNELAGAYVNIVTAAGALQETRVIASNTSDTVTINGTWSSTNGSSYIYTIWRTIYCGAANHPWQRLYTMTDIRFGAGTSNKTADGVATSFMLTKESDTALSIGSAYGSTGTTTALAAGFTITPLTSFHVLTAAAAITSDTTTAISNGSFIGQILILRGYHGTNTITIKDNANTSMAGDVVLGGGDTLSLIWDGTDWLETSRSDNT